MNFFDVFFILLKVYRSIICKYVFGFFGKVMFDSSQKILLSLSRKRLGILTENVAMVLIKVLPNMD